MKFELKEAVKLCHSSVKLLYLLTMLVPIVSVLLIGLTTGNKECPKVLKSFQCHINYG